jgi:hypothetical protein
MFPETGQLAGGSVHATPLVFIQPISLSVASVTQMFPSDPAVMPFGSMPKTKLVTAPSKLIASMSPSFAATHMRPSGPAVIPIGSKSMARTMKLAGVPAIRFHDLRHTFATLSLAARVPIHVVAEMLGHKSVKLVLDTYGHALPGMHEAAVDTIEAAF